VTEDDQLALAVDPPVFVFVEEARNGERRSSRFGPLPEPQARELISFLLHRAEPVDGAGPWRSAVAGGSRSVSVARGA
jgi:hypothetical protein